MKKVLILGANPETVSLILKAKEMGLYTIVTDYDHNAFAKKYADQAEDVNAVDVDALAELATREKVDGIIVGVAEALLPAYCRLCEKLGMPAFSDMKSFEIMTRKDHFKEKHPDCWTQFGSGQPYGDGWRYTGEKPNTRYLPYYQQIRDVFMYDKYPNCPNNVGWYFEEKTVWTNQDNT